MEMKSSIHSELVVIAQRLRTIVREVSSICAVTVNYCKYGFGFIYARTLATQPHAIFINRHETIIIKHRDSSHLRMRRSAIKPGAQNGEGVLSLQSS